MTTRPTRKRPPAGPPDGHKTHLARSPLRLALVSCPVALYNARHDRAGIRFNLINPETGNRIRMITQDGEIGQELERHSLVKGYEFRKGKYLLLSDDDLDSVKVESSSVMTIEKFVDTVSIDPVYYDSAYYLVPDGDADEKAAAQATTTPSRKRA
jgi:DNA end-binding protein Ku